MGSEERSSEEAAMSSTEELARLKQRQAELEVMYDTVRDVTSTLSFGEVLQRILDRTLLHLSAEIGSILLVEPDGGLKVAAAVGLPEDIVRDSRLEPGEGISGYVASTGQPLLVEDIEADDRFQPRNRERYYTHSLISAPIAIHDKVRGVLNVHNKETHEVFGEGDLRLIEAIAAHAAIALQNAERYEELLERAQRDALTGLANHGHFWSCLELELQRARRYDRGLSVVMIDVDHFKAFNDAQGHTGGDEALVSIARLILDRCRSSDLAARYGGDEFALILPETTWEGAEAFGEKIRQSIGEERFGRDGTLRLGVSIGVSALAGDGDTARALVECADRQLYRAKSLGRNQVCSESS